MTQPSSIAHYRITARLGAGGMGEVYRATDTKLDREVAIKILPEAFAADPDRMARFTREAKVLASLNSPNIAAVYGVEDRALIMELVEGPTLAEGIEQGPIPCDEALRLARQIAEALEYAHERGVVHRDLKPANIKVTPEGRVKVLDFGLAKALASEPASGDPADSPTLTMRATAAGVILGTAAYMSPEQAAGKPVDKRADIWSFGVVLWELLTAHRLFDGETVTHTLADVLRKDIDFAKLPAETPPAVRTLLRRCLDRDARNRLRDIGEARIAIDAAVEPAEPAAPPPQARSAFAWIAAAAVLAVAFAVLAFVHFREIPAPRQHVRFQIKPPEGELLDFQLSPDGRFLAFVTGTGSSTRKLWIRSLDALDTRLLTEIQGLRHFTMFWSRDGEHIAFQSADKLYQILRTGGPPVVLTVAPQPIGGGAWLDSGVILFGMSDGLFRISSSGGAPVKIDDHLAALPAWLPNRHFLYARSDGVFAGSLDGGKPVRILPERTASTYVPPPKSGLPGHLLFVRGGTLLAQAFHPDKLEIRGDAIPIAEHVGELTSAGTGAFTASANGALVFGHGNSRDAVLTWLDRAGKRLQAASKPFRLASNPAIRLSPDDSRAIVPIAGAQGIELWIADLIRNTFSRFTFSESRAGIWSPDGRKVLWAASDGNRYLRSADGSGKDELLYKDPTCNTCYPTDWSLDGKFITFAQPGEKAALDLWLVPAGGDRKAYPYLQSRFATYWAQISPDNRWMAYVSDQSPQPLQVFVESIPVGKGRWQISTESGDWPIWGRDGKELFYRQGTQLMAVPIRLTGTSVESGKPRPLFEVPAGTRFQVSRDGKSFLIALPAAAEGAGETTLTVDTDWRAGLAK